MSRQGRAQAPPLSDPLLLAYEDRLRRLKRQPATLLAYRQAARRLEEFLDTLGITAEQAEPWQLEEFLAGLELAPSTKRLTLEHVRAAYRYAQRRGVVKLDPTYDLLVERAPDEEPRIIPNGELRRMKGRITSDAAWILFHLLAYAGLRRYEARKLIWADVELRNQTLKVRGKGGKLRLVPIHPALGEALAEECRRNGACPDDYVLRSRRIKAAAMSYGTLYDTVREFTDNYTPHDFRRTVASSLYANGVRTDTIDKIMGWAPRAVRSRYYLNQAPLLLQQAILRLYADDPV